MRFRSAPADPVAMERNSVLDCGGCVAAQRAYKILRTRVLQRMLANRWVKLAVTGTTAGEGKTLAAINLALALAEDVGTSVFLVDLDLQRPKIAEYLGMACEHGLTDYLTGSAQIEEIIYDIGRPRLAVVPNINPTSDSSELLRSPRMHELLAALETEAPQRVILFDMPPLLASDDVLAFGPLVDSFLLVISQGQTARRSLTNAREMLAEMNVLGVILNRSTESNDSRYY
jgi:capsular exopolysaccharide synthesis family protein